MWSRPRIERLWEFILDKRQWLIQVWEADICKQQGLGTLRFLCQGNLGSLWTGMGGLRGCPWIVNNEHMHESKQRRRAWASGENGLWTRITNDLGHLKPPNSTRSRLLGLGRKHIHRYVERFMGVGLNGGFKRIYCVVKNELDQEENKWPNERGPPKTMYYELWIKNIPLWYSWGLFQTEQKKTLASVDRKH